MERLYREQLRDARDATSRFRYRAAVAGDALSGAWNEWETRTRAGARRWIREGMGMGGWRQDLTFGVRTLARRPGFTAAAVLTLALGIGATVSIFSVVNGVLLDPLPYPDSDRLVVLWNRNTEDGTRGRGVDHPDVRLIQETVPGLSLVGFSGTRPTVTGLGDPTVVTGVRVTDGLLSVMGYQPQLGRDLTAADDVLGGPRVMVVSHDFWIDMLGRDPDVLGRTVMLSGGSWEIVGVAPEGFDFPNGSELWLPRRHDQEGCDHGCRILNAVGRIDADRTLEEVQSALTATSTRLAEEFPDVHRDDMLELQGMLDYEVADVRAALWVLLGAVGMVLLIACANVANLLLVRTNGRRSEVALRATLGASRMRIVRQLLTESALLGIAGGVLGLLVAYWGTDALVGLAPEGLPRLDRASLDGKVVAFAAALVVLVTAMFGVLPALQATGARGAARSGRRAAGGRHAGRSRTALLVGEVALSLTLLLGAGLLMRTLGEMRAVDLGFDVERIERFRLSLPDARYDSVRVGVFLQEIEDELTRLPGVASAGWGFGVPLASGNITASIMLTDRPEVPPPDRPAFAVRPSTPGFLSATGTQLVRGRWFDSRDVYGSQPVAVINQAALRAHYADRDPLGLTIRPEVSWGFETSPEHTIVGIVADVARSGPTEEPDPAVYIPNTQFGANSGYMSIRLEAGATTAIPEARRIVAERDPGLAIWDVTTMEEVVSRAHAPTVFYTTLLSVFSVVALLLAAVGLYGVVAYAVSQRTREIGIRIALGAAADEVTGMVLREGIRPALLGIGLGFVLSWFGAKLLSSMLFGVGWGDPITIVTVPALLLAVTAVAAAIPARRASKVPPATALRAE